LQGCDTGKSIHRYSIETEQSGWKNVVAAAIVVRGVVRAIGMPEMNENVSSGAGKGLEPSGAAQEAAALLRTAATALLSAAEIWSTSPVVPAKPEAAVMTPPVVASADVTTPEPDQPETATASSLPSEELLAEARFFSSHQKREQESQATTKLEPADVQLAGSAPSLLPEASIDVEIARALERHAAAALAQARESVQQPRTWPPAKLSLALQGGGSFGAFTWGVLERLLEEPACDFDTISGASVGAVNAALLACGMVKGGREGARRQLAGFWQRMTNETSFRSLMLIGGYSQAGSAVAFGPTLRSGQFDPFDLDPLREALCRDIDFAALRSPNCPKLLIAATRVRDGRQQIFGNADITADALLASTCPPLVHGAVEIDGESYWDGGYGANPPLVRLVQDSAASDVLVVRLTPSRDSFVPLTMAAVDRRLDQITANAVLNAELAALEWARESGTTSTRAYRIAAEDEIDNLAQRSASDLGRGFISLLHGRGRAAADRWLGKSAAAKPAPAVETEARLELVDA
jgi:NTE family protein